MASGALAAGAVHAESQEQVCRRAGATFKESSRRAIVVALSTGSSGMGLACRRSPGQTFPLDKPFAQVTLPA